MKIQKCPKCKSTSIVYHAGIVSGKYHCKKCGLTTAVILEEDIDVEKYKKIKKQFISYVFDFWVYYGDWTSNFDHSASCLSSNI